MSETDVARTGAEDRLINALAEDSWDIGMIWEFCAHFEVPDRTETVDAMCAWLGPPDGLRILDSACGSGFPALELARRGYRIVGTDGSASMIERLRRNLELEGLSMPWAQARWEWLGHLFPESFDVIMCRGASFIYAGTWEVDGPPDRRALEDSMSQFAATLRPGGRVYVDNIRPADLAGTGQRIIDHPAILVGGHRIELVEMVTNHPDEGMRTWATRLTVDGTTHEFSRRSHLLTEEQLTELMTTVGLTDVRRLEIPGEHYAVYTATRPGH